MNSDFSNLEADLRALQAAPLDDALLARLEAAADGNLTVLTQEELRLETQLRATAPAQFSPEYLAELEAVFRNVPFPINDKIVLFPKANTAPRQTTQRPMWAAAAAVALIGATTALLLPPAKPSGKIAAASPTSTHNAQPISGNFTPSQFNRNVVNVSDGGVVWKSNTQPQHVLRIGYTDLFIMEDENGRTLKFEVPSVREVMVPAKTD